MGRNRRQGFHSLATIDIGKCYECPVHDALQRGRARVSAERVRGLLSQWQNSCICGQTEKVFENPICLNLRTRKRRFAAHYMRICCRCLYVPSAMKSDIWLLL